MAEPEYGDKFSIYLTPANGLKVLLNPVLVDIADIMAESEMTAAEISDRVGASRSTVRSDLKRLADMGMVTTKKSTVDARETLYILRGIKVVSSADPNDAVLKYLQNSSKARSQSQIMPIYDAILFSMAQIRTYGLSIVNVLFEAGFAIGMAFSELFAELSDEEMVHRIKCLFGLASDLRIEEDDEGLSVSVGPGDIQSVMLIKDLLMGFLISMIGMRTGNLYSVRFSTVLEDDAVIFNSKLYSAGDNPTVGLTYAGRGPSFYSVDNPFVVLYTRGGSCYLISNENMIRVLDAIADEYSTPVDIATATEIPHVTVHSVLNKLESMGVLTKSASSRVLSFDPTYSKIIQGKSEPVDAPPQIDISNIKFEASSFRRFVYRYMFWVADNFGIGAEATFRKVGAYMGEVLVTTGPRIGAQEFLESVCSSYAMDGADITITSLIPVYITLKIESCGRFADDVGIYLESMLEKALEIITGEHYRVIVDVRAVKRVGRSPARSGIQPDSKG